MSKRAKRIDEDILENRIIVSLIIVAVVVIISIAYIWISSSVKDQTNIGEQISQSEKQEGTEISINNEENTEIVNDAESASSTIGKTVEESENTTTNNNLNQENADTDATLNSNNSNSNKKTEENTNSQVENIQKQEETQPDFIFPVTGDIIREFSKENLVFSETLQEWIVHPALDMKANSRDVVKCAADGTVKAIKSDPRYGLTVIVEHSSGFQTIYSNLLTAEYVVEGEQVKKGQTIGTVGSSAVFEIADESHLHFEMLLNSEYVDPSLYIK